MRMDFLKTIAAMTSAEFLVGPHRDISEAVVSNYFSVKFHDMVDQLAFAAGVKHVSSKQLHIGTPLDVWVQALAQQSPVQVLGDAGGEVARIVPLIFDSGLDDGLAALAPRTDGAGYHLCGLFLNDALCVDGAMRGIGIGRALIVQRALRDERLPTWHDEKTRYSEKGLAVMISAFRELQSIADVEIEREPVAEPA